MKVEESLNVTLDETPPLPKTPPLEDDELVEEEAIEGSNIETIVYANSDHAGDYVDRKSTSGVCTFMGCCLTSWFSKKQTALAISTTEVEYVSAGKACQQALWMKQALVDYGVRLKFKFEGDNTLIVIQPPCYSTSKDFQDSPDDEEDTRSSHEYLNDLDSSALAPSSFSSKNKGLIAKSHNWDEEEVSSDDEETEVKALMALTDEERIFVGKESARNVLIKLIVNEQILTQKKIILGIGQLAEDTSSCGSKDLVFVKSSADNSDMSITSSNLHKSSEAEDSTLPNHDIDEVSLNKSQRNTTDPSAIVPDSPTPDYDSANESSVCSTPLLLLKKLDSVEPGSGPKTVKSILKSKSTFKAKTLKGITLNEPSSAPARGNKSSSASKTNSTPAGKLKNVNVEDDPPLAMVIKELNELKLQISKKRSSYSRNNNTQQKSSTCHKNCKTYGSNVHTTSDHNDIEWFRKRETPYAKKFESSNALRSNTPTKREVGLNTFRNAIGAHYLPHSSEYVVPPSIDIVRKWFPMIRYGEEVSTKRTLRKSLLPPSWRQASGLQCSKNLFKRSKPRHKKPVTSSKQPSVSNKEATKSGSSKSPTGSKTGDSKRRKVSSLAMDSNPNRPLVYTPVNTEMHKEDQQAIGGPTSLGATSEERANPQLSSDFTAKADPGLSAPNDSIPPQQGIDEGTKNTSYDHLSACTDLHVLADLTKSISEGLKTVLTQPTTKNRASSTAIHGDKEEASTVIHGDKEEASSTINLEDLAKIMSQIQPSFKDLDSTKDDPVIIIDESDEDEPNAKTKDT
nr:retrovirus-related Pol polyprotein from transposon TNT 1-94 [Tanacetum cinerariifolium]